MEGTMHQVITEETLMKCMEGSLWVLVSEGEKCKLCGKIFRLPQKRKRGLHRALHLGKIRRKPFQCNECDKSFDSQKKLVKHTNNHDESKQIVQGILFNCQHCDKAFPSQKKLVKHTNHHEQNKLRAHGILHKCQHCDKVFGTRNMYQEHILTHPGANFFHCYECKERFMTSNEFQQHLETSKHDKVRSGPVLGKGKTIPCGQCNKLFKTLRGLTDHMKDAGHFDYK